MPTPLLYTLNYFVLPVVVALVIVLLAARILSRPKGPDGQDGIPPLS
ncbi:hypothetical protein [Nesterenkonia flava]|uniref:Uncharacterized protein n=1 Tax=Nesterenkonia flava TaxID=469799 RepID=A0ABU1FR59_9MICC|nr:hypothetical protein [Nesterenkonia flava]MDR5711141.1 hypothetical protein [Nesterenkonia flava]